MGCCTSLPVVGPCFTTFCNLLNNFGCEWADKNRATLIYLNTFLVAAAVLFSCIGVAGLSTQKSVITEVPWMTYTGDASPGLTVYINLQGRYAKGAGLDTFMKHSDTDCNTTAVSAASTVSADDCQNCVDACEGLQKVVIVMLVVNVLTMVQIFGRFKREDDRNKKCMSVITSILPIVFNISSLVAFAQKCYADMDKLAGIQASRGIGWISLLIALFVGKIPNLIINLIIPAPDLSEFDKEQEGDKLQEDPENPNSQKAQVRPEQLGVGPMEVEEPPKQPPPTETTQIPDRQTCDDQGRQICC